MGSADLRQAIQSARHRPLPPLDVDALWVRGRRQRLTRRLAGTLTVGMAVAGLVLALSALPEPPSPSVAPLAPPSTVASDSAPAPTDRDALLRDALGTGWSEHRLVFAVADQVYSVRLDGSDRRQLTSGSGWNIFPQISPDGRSIAYTHGGAATSEGGEATDGAQIWLMSSDGSNPQPITNEPAGVGANFASWSPDGEAIIYVSNIAGPNRISRQLVAGGPAEVLVERGGDPRLSPDGARLAYNDAGGIWVANADGSGAVRLGDGAWPSWSPDGARIAFVHAGAAGEDAVWVMEADGDDRRQLTSAPDTALRGAAPGWSPDGRWILVQEQGRSLGLIEVDGPRTVSLFPNVAWGTHWWWPRG